MNGAYVFFAGQALAQPGDEARVVGEVGGTVDVMADFVGQNLQREILQLVVLPSGAG